MLTLTRPSSPGVADADVPDRIWADWSSIMSCLVVLTLFGVVAFEHRWIADDGMIVVREVRQILAGNGPNYNPFQRDEIDTSPLWTWLLAAVAFVVRGDIAVDAVWFGLVASVAGLAFAMLGSRALHQVREPRDVPGLLVPAGALVPLGIGGFWDFATSGLETGLSLLWLGASWWLLAGLTPDSRGRRMITTAVVIGLGPLVRPDFALVTVVFGAAQLLITRPGWPRGLLQVGLGLLVPAGYQVFRMGYYGITVPMPALAKEADSALWDRGLNYLDDFVDTYVVWIPLAILCVIGTHWLTRLATDRRTALLVAAPVLSGILLGAYVVRVGGDYMHARMWVPVVFALLLPVMLMRIGRARRVEAAGVAVVAGWALLAAIQAHPSYRGVAFGPGGLVDERTYEVGIYTDAHPTSSESRTRDNELRPTLSQALASGDRLMVMSSSATANGSLWAIKMADGIPDHDGFFYDNMGVTDVVMPLNGTVVDVNGLGTPLAGHLRIGERGRPGHEKWLPAAWVLAEYADPAVVARMSDTQDVTRVQVVAARHVLSCGAVRELMRSVDQPMTWGRFWDNLTGSFERSSLRIPADPVEAEREFCH